MGSAQRDSTCASCNRVAEGGRVEERRRGTTKRTDCIHMFARLQHMTGVGGMACLFSRQGASAFECQVCPTCSPRSIIAWVLSLSRTKNLHVGNPWGAATPARCKPSLPHTCNGPPRESAPVSTLCSVIGSPSATTNTMPHPSPHIRRRSAPIPPPS